MPAIVTNQFRISNASNFVDSVSSTSNSYYVFVGLSNPTSSGYGRKTDWNSDTDNPIDNLDYLSFSNQNMCFGRKVNSSNIRRIVKKHEWIRGRTYEMYRHDYSASNLTKASSSASLYDSNYYVVNSNYQVYICLDNGTAGITTVPQASLDEPTFTDLEPSAAGSSNDGYTWKYLFTIPSSDIIKFDSTEYISLPNEWETTTSPQIVSIRDNGNSDENSNQIKIVSIDSQGVGYLPGVHQLPILGDGTGATVIVTVSDETKITDTVVSTGGKGYTYGIVDLSSINSNVGDTKAKLTPIIPPSKGHGYDIYTELGADKVLIYTRFDSSTKDFPVDTKFAQIGIIKNPKGSSGSSIYSLDTFSSAKSILFSSVTGVLPVVGDTIEQQNGDETSKGYVISYDEETKLLKYIKERSLYLNPTLFDSTDFNTHDITTYSSHNDFTSSSDVTVSGGSFVGQINSGFTGVSTTNSSGTGYISLGIQIQNGLSESEINTNSGEILYLNNRPYIERNLRQKEDVKIILEF